MKISAVFITLNEQDRLEEALLSCNGLVDEIVVLDSYSTDETENIARRHGARFFQHEFRDYGDQKNRALDLARHDWVLNLDADERLSDELRREIEQIRQNPEPGSAGFLIPRRTYYLGRWIRHSGWYPDRKLRLFRRSLARWQGRIHERLVLEGTPGRLRGAILHFSYRDLADHLERMNRYSGFQAESIRGPRGLLLAKALLSPPFTFIRHYFWKMGLLDGFPGLVIALVSSWGTAAKYLKAAARHEP